MQNYSNHHKRPSVFFLAGVVIGTGSFLYFGVRTVTDFSSDLLVLAFLSLSVVALGVQARRFALGVQDRAIRHEERRRLEELLPAELGTRINELATDQLIALRFASDGEVATLVQRVLEGELTERKEIKMAVKEWRADHQRI